nr:MAG TPA: transport protein [Caudoviricetes sp.]
MAYKDKYEVLGVIVALATNGLSVYKKGEEEGQISGGSIGDVVVRAKDESGFASVSIIGEQEWEEMPQNEAAEAEMKDVASDTKNLAPELAKAKNEIERLKAEILEAKGEAERFKEECTNLQDHVSALAGENLALSQKIQKLEAENKKLKEATKKEDKNKTDSAPKTNESQKGLNLGGNE